MLSACLSTTDCYLAQQGHAEIIVGGTTEEVGFDAHATAAPMHSLAAGAVRAIPLLESVALKRVYSGFRPGTPEERPILGPVRGLQGYLNACGHFRTGTLNSALTGEIVSALAAGEEAPYPIEPFLLARFSGAPGSGTAGPD